MRRRYLDRSVLSLMPLAHFARHFPHSQIDVSSTITNGEYWLAVRGRHQPEVVVANVAAHHPALSRTPVGRAEAVAPGLHSSILWWPSLRLNNHSLPHMKGIGQKTKFE